MIGRMRDSGALDALMERALRAGRIPGAALAIVPREGSAVVRAYGSRDVSSQSPMTVTTRYPIGSTTKAMTATLLGILVDEGLLDWDAPLQEYLPRFRLADASRSAQVTLRDCLAMRTGLPRHDWVFDGNRITRADLLTRLRFLKLSAGFRERFQYNNLLVVIAGHVAEVVTGTAWEDLLQSRLLGPLGMDATSFGPPAGHEVTLSYHEDKHRALRVTLPRSADDTGPSGGSIYSTVEDMARWVAFNLNAGQVHGRALIRATTLEEIHSPQVVARTYPACPSPHATYAMGWFVDTYNGRSRISHGGYLHDIYSDVSLHPDDGLGIVSFTNFGAPRLTRLLNQLVFDFVREATPASSVERQLAAYEQKIEEQGARNRAARRIADTTPSHALSDYVGVYEHPGYGTVYVIAEDNTLVLERRVATGLRLPLEHWHYDVWVAKSDDQFPLHEAHSFDRANGLQFETRIDGAIGALSIRFEPAVEPIRFEKREVCQ
jgi:CubicO group peptidase (beta-lactamase class C family)